MSLIQLSRISLAYGLKPLLDQVDWVIEERQRVGLIGRNGAGKSSLLGLLAGQIQADDGLIHRSEALRLAYVPQTSHFDPQQTVAATLEAALAASGPSVIEYQRLLEQLASADASEQALLTQRLTEVESHLHLSDGWSGASRLEALWQSLELNPQQQVGQLSGGGQKRLALAVALVAQPQLLLLDEPTNHLDLAGIEWLEEFIANFDGAVVLISHDRRFLDRLCHSIVELDRGQLRHFVGGYSRYREEKLRLLELERQQWHKFDKLLAGEEVWIRQGIEARRTRNEGRVRRLEQLRRQRQARREVVARVVLAQQQVASGGRLVAECRHISYAIAGKELIRGFSTRIERGDRIGLVGPNGVGKTTLIRLLLGQLQPSSGVVRLGSGFELAYFDQQREQLKLNASLIDNLELTSDMVEIGSTRQHPITYLESFLFPPERARSPVSSLSGGERNRLLLARLFTRPSNILVLDEPTNDLDIDTLEVLEERLANYSGTLLVVSHDREFLENTVSSLISFEGHGLLLELAGGYDDFAALRASQKPRPKTKAATPTTTPKKNNPAPTPEPALSGKEHKELLRLPQLIDQLEAEQQSLCEQLSQLPASSPASERLELQRQLEQLTADTTAAMARWEALERRLGKQ